MNITVVGTGYVGLVSGVCYAEMKNNVICVDRDDAKIDMLKRCEVPIYEPGLKELITHNSNEGRLRFSTDLSTSIQEASIIVIAVGTPSLPSGEANLQYVEQVARDIALSMSDYKIIMTKSTVPVGTNERLIRIIRELTDIPFDVVSVPEFLREGTAIRDTKSPDRIVIGAERESAAQVVVELHKPFTEHMIITDIRSAEMIKYASNAFLATKISFINEIANICEKVGADVSKVAQGMGYDNRIGQSFLNAGIGYGGSCFPKDTRALIQIAGNVDYDFKLLRAVVEVNQDQRYNIINQLLDALGTLSGKKVGVWGLAFKPNTDDIRDAPSVDIVNALIGLGAVVQVYDPIAMDRFLEIAHFSEVKRCLTPLDAAQGCDAVCLLTEWDEFKQLDLQQLEEVLRTPVLIDGRNVYSSDQIAVTNLHYYSVGRPKLNRMNMEMMPT
jgi:UDPglucose 6-dehydrogenase